MPEFAVQPFQAEHTDAVLRIAADTAFFGEPVEVFLEDRLLFCDAFYRYYTTFEAQSSWVALAEGDVVGFLMGCRDSRSQARRWVRRILPGVLSKALRGRYRLGPNTWRYVRGLVSMWLWEGTPHVDLSRYPAHLHINVAATARGQGVGRRLIQAYLEQLRQAQCPGVHLNTTDHNRAACHLYENSGFRVLEAHTTHIWSPWGADPVECRCYGQRLTP